MNETENNREYCIFFLQCNRALWAIIGPYGPMTLLLSTNEHGQFYKVSAFYQDTECFSTTHVVEEEIIEREA